MLQLGACSTAFAHVRCKPERMPPTAVWIGSCFWLHSDKDNGIATQQASPITNPSVAEMSAGRAALRLRSQFGCKPKTDATHTNSLHALFWATAKGPVTCLHGRFMLRRENYADPGLGSYRGVLATNFGLLGWTHVERLWLPSLGEREYCDLLGAQGKTHRPKAVSIRQPSAQAVRNARTSSELFHTRQSEQNVLWTSESKVGLPCARSVLVGLQDPSGRALPFVRCRGLSMALAEFVVSRAPFAGAPFARSSH